MSKKRVWYKVVRKAKSHYRSARAGGLSYVIGQKTVPSIPNSRIFIFKEEHDARAFMHSYESVLACHAEKPRKAQWMVEYGNISAEFWQGEKDREYRHMKRWWKKGEVPPGTYFAQSVTPIKELK